MCIRAGYRAAGLRAAGVLHVAARALPAPRATEQHPEDLSPCIFQSLVQQCDQKLLLGGGVVSACGPVEVQETIRGCTCNLCKRASRTWVLNRSPAPGLGLRGSSRIAWVCRWVSTALFIRLHTTPKTTPRTASPKDSNHTKPPSVGWIVEAEQLSRKDAVHSSSKSLQNFGRLSLAGRPGCAKLLWLPVRQVHRGEHCICMCLFLLAYDGAVGHYRHCGSICPSPQAMPLASFRVQHGSGRGGFLQALPQGRSWWRVEIS